jgi:hypothetical protein
MHNDNQICTKLPCEAVQLQNVQVSTLPSFQRVTTQGAAKLQTMLALRCWPRTADSASSRQLMGSACLISTVQDSMCPPCPGSQHRPAQQVPCGPAGCAHAATETPTGHDRTQSQRPVTAFNAFCWPLRRLNSFSNININHVSHVVDCGSPEGLALPARSLSYCIGSLLC